MKQTLFYTAIKTLMGNYGFKTTDGEDWTVQDNQTWKDFAFFRLGISHVDAEMGLAYPDMLPDHVRSAISSGKLENAPAEAPVDTQEELPEDTEKAESAEEPTSFEADPKSAAESNVGGEEPPLEETVQEAEPVDEAEFPEEDKSTEEAPSAGDEEVSSEDSLTDED